MTEPGTIIACPECATKNRVRAVQAGVPRTLTRLGRSKTADRWPIVDILPLSLYLNG